MLYEPAMLVFCAWITSCFLPLSCLWPWVPFSVVSLFLSPQSPLMPSVALVSHRLLRADLARDFICRCIISLHLIFWTKHFTNKEMEVPGYRVTCCGTIKICLQRVWYSSLQKVEPNHTPFEHGTWTVLRDSLLINQQNVVEVQVFGFPDRITKGPAASFLVLSLSSWKRHHHNVRLLSMGWAWAQHGLYMGYM